MTRQEKLLLRKLIRHLRSGKLLHDHFNYGIYNGVRANIDETFKTVELKNRLVRNCGTMGCAIGELPAIDKRFKFGKPGIAISSVMLNGKQVGNQEFLGLSDRAYKLMFIPNTSYFLWRKSKKVLVTSPPSFVSKDIVANHIELVLNLINKGYEPGSEL